MKPLITQTRRHNLAIEVTYDCNIKCQNCNRYCPEAPGGVESYMSLEQINHFVQETYTMNHFWTVVKIAGGEPMMHPDIMGMLNILEPLHKDGYAKKVYLLTNGVAAQKIKTIPPWVIVVNSSKTAKPVTDYHGRIGPAPSDIQMKVNLETNQCLPAVSDCSICLDAWGYYLTGPCAAVDRLFGLNVGVKSLKEILDTDYKCLDVQQKLLCQYCGCATSYVGIPGNYSPILQTMFKRISSAHIGMTRYGT